MTTDIWTQFRQVALSRPHHPAIVRGEATLTFEQLQQAAACGASLLQQRGLMKGHRCLLWAENSPDLAVAILAALAVGAIPTMINAEAPISHVMHAATRTGATLAIADAARLPNLQFDGPVLLIEEMGANSNSPISMFDHTGIATTEPASIFFTSGSTGLPKGVTQSHQNLIWGASTVGQCIGFRATDSILCAIPWAFDYGWGQLLSTFVLGITQILPAGRSSIAVCEAIDRHRPTILPSVPSLIGNLIRGISTLRDIDRTSVRLITNTGSRIPAPLFPEIEDLFPNTALSLNYGLTETYRTASLPLHLAKTHPASVGRAIPGVQIAVLRGDGSMADAGEEGEIVHRGGGVFLGYWGEPEKTAAVRRPDPLWQHQGVSAPAAVFTGDLGYFDKDGLLYINGRRDRQIKSMGVRVSPDEVESIIHATGLVEEVAIFSKPHDIVGDMVVAAVVPKEAGPETVKRLKSTSRQTMSQFMQPMEWHVLDKLPRTPSAKVDYVALKRIYGQPVQP